MTYEAFTNNLNPLRILLKNHLLFVLILIASVLYRLSIIPEAFPFDYDQSVAAEAAYEVIVNKHVSLIGQELSFPGFFLGPAHNLVSTIPYYICGLSPGCVPYFFMVLSIFTIIVLYKVVSLIFGEKISLLVTLFYSLSFSSVAFEIGVNSNYFLFLSSILLLFCLFKYLSGKNIYIVLGALLGGLATVNFNPVFIFSLAVFYFGCLSRGKINFFYIGISVLAFFINYIPLILFNFRNNNILINNLLHFISQNTGGESVLEKLVFLIEKVFVPYHTHYLLQSTKSLFLLAFLGLFLYGCYYLLATREKLNRTLVFWSPLVIFGFIFYQRHIPEYYIQQTTLAVIIAISFALSRKKAILITFIVFFLFINLRQAFETKYPVNYRVKKEIVDYITSDSSDKKFNVYYNIPTGLNTGYATLFKLNKREPQENQENLYIIDYSSDEEFIKENKSTFASKNLQVRSFDSFVRVISVK